MRSLDVNMLRTNNILCLITTYVLRKHVRKTSYIELTRTGSIKKKKIITQINLS